MVARGREVHTFVQRHTLGCPEDLYYSRVSILSTVLEIEVANGILFCKYYMHNNNFTIMGNFSQKFCFIYNAFHY